MTAKDQLKLLKVGFTIIRTEGEETFADKKIKYKSSSQREWATMMSGIKTNSELKRKVTELLKSPLIVED